MLHCILVLIFKTNYYIHWLDAINYRTMLFSLNKILIICLLTLVKKKIELIFN